MEIYTLHGIVNQFEEEKQICRNYNSYESLHSYLKTRTLPFVNWEGETTIGDVITVDDSTRAGAEACKVIRSLGHDVIFFINPYQIITGTLYYFTLLDTIIDYRTIQEVYFNGSRYNLVLSRDLLKFRKDCKRQLMVLHPHEALSVCENEIATLLQVKSYCIPEDLKPITIQDIYTLKNIGVRIESHGWDHTSITSFTHEQHIEDINRTSNWIYEKLSQRPTLYAVPFGYPSPHTQVQSVIHETCFLLDPTYSSQHFNPVCWNRIDLNSSLRKIK